MPLINEIVIGLILTIAGVVLAHHYPKLFQKKEKKFIGSLDSDKVNKAFVEFLFQHHQAEKTFKLYIHLTFDDFMNFRENHWFSLPNSISRKEYFLEGGYEIHIRRENANDYLQDDRPGYNRIEGRFRVVKISGLYQGWIPIELEFVK